MQNENTGRVNNYQAKLKENILARINKKNKISQSALLENVDSTNQQFKATPKVVFNKKLKNKMFKTQIVVNEKVVPTFVNDKQLSVNNLKIDDFQIGEFLGRGANCSAHIGRHIQTGFFCCIKTMNRAKVEENLEKFIKGLKIQMYVNHPNVAKTYGIIVQKTKVYIIMELCLDGDLSANLKQTKKDSDKCQQSIKGIIRGLKYLHEQNIQHRDLKLQNVLISYSMVKISDFDLAVYYEKHSKLMKRSSLCGSPLYFSPQMLEKLSYYKEADIWCLGIITYELVCGCFPFQIKSYEDLRKIVIEEIKYPESLGAEAKDLLSRLLVKNPEERICLDEIVRHPFFESEGHSAIEH